MNRSEAKEFLKGPVPSIRTPFDKNGDVDYRGLRNNIDFLLNCNIRTIMLTAGDSHYDCLSDEEIAEVTRITIEQTANKAKIIAADRYHSTARAVKFAKFASETGADFSMCLPPDWGNSCNPRTLSEHYAEVSNYLPVMIVTNRFIHRGEEFGLDTLERSFQKSERIVAVKDDMCGRFAWKLSILASKYNVATIAGGMKYNHMNMLPYGVDGYLSTFLNFKPEVTSQYCKAIESNDIKAATTVIAEVDIPFFEHIVKGPGSYDAAIHAVMEIFGIYKRYRRKPYYTYSDKDMEKYKVFLRQIKVY